MDFFEYDYEYDKEYCYKNTNVLVNKLNIKDKEKLKNAEIEITAYALAEAEINFIKGKFDIKHLLDIHKFIFEDIYYFAGKYRNVNISKGNEFCDCRFIEDNLKKILDKLKEENYLRETSENEISTSLAYYLSEINVIHPFREGNGRTQRLFIEYLALINGYDLDFSKISKDEMIIASAESFACNYEPMNLLIKKCISKSSEYNKLECFQMIFK